MSTTQSERLIRVLALDGGGVRGLSSLLILRDVMKMLAVRRKQHMLPCECFDLIIGTGTGGISALFLGRMRMSVDQAIEEFIRIGAAIFDPNSTRNFQRPEPDTPLLDTATLGEAIGDVAQRMLGDRDASLASPSCDTSVCRTAVLAATSDNIDAPPHIFRSYSDGYRPASTFTICNVARATAATAGIFTPVSLGQPPIKFIDAGVSGYNNPAEIGFDEARELWPGREVDCFVSLGSGLQSIVSLGPSPTRIAESCRAIVNDCEKVHERILRTLPDEFPYFRLNVVRGLAEMHIMEWRNAEPEGPLAGITESNMRLKDIETRLKSCVRAMDGQRIGTPYTPAIVDDSNTIRHNAGIFSPTLNPPPAIFYGRRDEMEQTVAHFESEPAARIAILGTIGIGKTSLALAILHDARIEEKFKENRRFIACDGITSVPRAIDAMCAAFALHGTSANRREDLIVFLKSTYTSHPVLIVLDNFETVWDIQDTQTEAEQFLRDLGSVKLLSLVLTMRGAERPTSIRWSFALHVGPLDPIAARSIFTDVRAGGHTDDNKLNELLEAVDYVPLAITLMARLGQVESPAALFQRWTTEQTRLLSRSWAKHRLENLDVSINISIQSNRIQSTPGALLLLHVISMLPSGVFDGDLPLVCPRIPDLAEASATLREVALAYYDSARTLRVLSPIRLHILKHYEIEDRVLEDVQSFHFTLAEGGSLNPGDPGYKGAVDTLPRYGPNIEAIITQALTRTLKTNEDAYGRAVDAAIDWTSFYPTTYPRTRSQRTIIALALEFVQRHPRHPRLANCLQWQGIVQRLTSDYTAARETLTAAQGAFETAGNRRGAAQCHLALAELHSEMGNHNKALDALRAARRTYQNIRDSNGVADCYLVQGELHREEGKHDAALEYLNKARVEFESIHDETGVASCLRALGELHGVAGRHAIARVSFNEARTAFKAVHDRLGVADCLRALGELQSEMGECEAARVTLEEAKQEYEALNDRRRLGWCLQKLAYVQRQTTDFDAALNTLTEARLAFEVVNYQAGIADCLLSLGELQHEMDDYDSALNTLVGARGAYEALEDRNGIADCLRALGELQNETSEYVPARKALKEAFKAYETLGDQSGAALSLYSLGDVQKKTGECNAARRTFKEAQRIFEDLRDRRGVARCCWNLADIQIRTDEYDAAQTNLSDARLVFEAINDQNGISDCLHSLGQLESEMAGSHSATETLMEARKGYAAVKNRRGVADCLLTLGKLQGKDAEYDVAHETLIEALQAFQAINNKPGIARCLWNLADIQTHMGAYDTAQDTLDNARQAFKVAKNWNGVADCLLALGQLQSEMGEYDIASRTLMEARNTFGDLNHWQGVRWCRSNLTHVQVQKAAHSSDVVTSSETFEKNRSGTGASGV